MHDDITNVVLVPSAASAFDDMIAAIGENGSASRNAVASDNRSRELLCITEGVDLWADL